MSEGAAEIHASDEQLISFLYVDDLPNPHIVSCPGCRARLASLRSHREVMESLQIPTSDISSAALAKQRQTIYARLSKDQSSWFMFSIRGWASAVTAAAVLCGGLVLFQHQQHQSNSEEAITDAELALEVSRLSQTAEPVGAEPLKGLFE